MRSVAEPPEDANKKMAWVLCCCWYGNLVGGSVCAKHLLSQTGVGGILCLVLTGTNRELSR